MIKKILLVDDDDTYHDIHRPLLESQGHRVIMCYDGAEIEEVLSKNAVDLIILDHNMPCMTGVDFLKKRSKNDEWMKIPVMMCTNNPPEYDEFKKIHANNWVVKFLSKPFQLSEIQM